MGKGECEVMQKKKVRHRLPEKSFPVPTCYFCEVPLEKVDPSGEGNAWKCPKCGITHFCPVCATCGKTVQSWDRTGHERNIIVARAVCMTCWNDKETSWDDGKCPRCNIDLWGKEAMKLRDIKNHG